jgi:pimeloyl-ACP methyl ester carboxylesterase
MTLPSLLTRRRALAAALLLLAACTTPPPPARPPAPAAPGVAPAPPATPPAPPPIVFVHGNGDTAGLWLTTMWRFESNGWPRERLHAIDLPLPGAREDDTREQPGRSSTAEHMAFLRGEVEQVLARTGAKQVVLVGNSRGGNAIRNYIVNGGGERTVSHAVLGGTPNHGVWAVPIEGLPDNSEFAGHGRFLSALNKPKNAAGDEVTGPVRWMTIRSDGNDKFAQADGLWLGRRGVATGVTAAGPELKGATNVVIPRIDHRETSFSPAAFEATYRFVTGRAPARTDIAPEARVTLYGQVSGAGTNIGLAGARILVHAIDGSTGQRRGAALLDQTVGADGRWGPLATDAQTRHEFVISAPGYATTHFYRSPFPRSTTVLNMRPERVPEADRNAPALVLLTRPRGYFDPARDKMSFDGQSPPPGALPGAGVSASRIKPAGPPRAVVAEFNGERVVGRTWPLAEGRVSVLELTY